MKYKIILLTIISIILFSGCTAKTKGFIEDLYSNNNTRSAQNSDYTEVTNKIIKTTNSKTQRVKQYNTLSGSYTATGKIIDASYDKDLNLYLYVFVKDGNYNPVTFYYNKNIEFLNTNVTITVKENFLKSISTNESIETKDIKSHKRILKKRIRSDIKTPIVEKINTL